MADWIPQLAVTFPKYPGEEQLVALPLVLPMGWTESGPYFCALTETVADIANNCSLKEILPPHPLEPLALTKPTNTTMNTSAPPKEPTATPKLVVGLTTPVTMSLLMEPQGEMPTVDQIATVEPLRSNKGLLKVQPELPMGPPVLCPFKKPVPFTDVYLADLINGIQGGMVACALHVQRLLYSIDDIFRP